MKTLIAPTDFSPISTNAINYAADMALEMGANLFLLYVYQVPIAVTDIPLPLLSVDELKEGAEQRLQHLKKDLQHITSGKLNIITETRLGDVIDELEDVCNTINPFAIIMGADDHSSIERTLFGHATLSASKRLTWPLISVPKGKEYGTGIKKIGLACDLEQVEETTPFESITEFVKEFHAELHVLNVETTHHQEQVAEQSEQTAILGTAIHQVNPQFHFIENNDIGHGISEFAEVNNLDLLIVIPKKHSLIEALFKKSPTKQLVLNSHIPVMCIHE
jgi:nucleotide-binding universal stress UspA family protein